MVNGDCFTTKRPNEVLVTPPLGLTTNGSDPAMATAASIILPVTAASPAPAAANNNVTDWTHDPRAAALLASCAANPPAGAFRTLVNAYEPVEVFAYIGYRAEALGAIREELGAHLLAAYQELGDAAYPAFNAWCRSPNVTDAIDAVLPLEMAA